ncbi:MAG: ATP-binding protein [Saccharofermentanales bacterium]|jgi:signal transduction histidine kinase
MQDSIILRRMMILLLLAIFLTVSLTSLFFGVISREILTRIKVDEMRPQANAIADLAYGRIPALDPGLDNLMKSAVSLFNSYIFVYDSFSGTMRHTSLEESPSLNAQAINDQITEESGPLLNGEASSLWFTTNVGVNVGNLLYIGVPVLASINGVDTPVGAVFFVRPMQELNASLRSMYFALMLSALAVAFLMLFPAYLGTYRIILPLKRTRDVAIAMAAGDFSQRADTEQKGEIGELAASINNLASDLSTLISELTLERNRLKQVIDGISEGIVAVDVEGKISLINQAMISLSNYESKKRSDAPDQPELPDDLPIGSGLGDLFLTVIQRNEPRFRLLDLGDRLLSVTITPLEGDQGQIAGAVGLFRDVTEAERLEQTRKDYVANVSHELRSPLTAMRALIEPLHEGMVHNEADRERYYDILLRETLRLSRLIEDMLELSRLQGGKISFTPVKFELGQMIDDLLFQYERRAQEAGIRLSAVESCINNCPPVFADPDRIEQVLIILLDNAFKFTEAGGSITLSCDWTEEQVLVKVADTGCGIMLEDVDSVFDRFYKADKAHNQPGTGLGLSIAREILTLAGEKISVNSIPGKGSTFSFTLRRAKN